MKKGFTLIEMIGVMVILSLLLLFATPNVINYIKSGGETKDKVVETMIFEGTKQYIIDNQSMYRKDSKNTYCISLNTLASEGYVESPIKLSSSDEDITSETSNKVIKVTYDKKYKYELVDECIGIVNPIPDLTQGLTPVMYDGNNWVVANPKTDDWYDYDNQKWANAVVLKQNSTKTVGDTVTVEGNDPDVVMMYVWIPRYEYKIEGDYGKGGTSTTSPGEIEVNFIGKNTTTPTTGYHIHPAFKFGDKEENGFWVGKFELSHTELSSSETDNNLGCTNGTSGVTCTADSTKFRILPNVPSLRKNNVSNFWYGIKTIESTNEFGLSNIDIHMMKNSEWGAVAYLSQSKYGKYGNKDYEGTRKEVYINNSSGYYTGRSGGNIGGSTPINGTYQDQSSTTKYNTTGFYTYDGYLLEYNTNNKTTTRDIKKGTGASTTGNIYGVYDMSGGALEYVMGAYGTEEDGVYSGYNTSSNSEFNGKTGYDNGTVTNGAGLPETKYYDIYANATNSYSNDGKLSCKNGNEYGVCYGHSISETSNWYGDYAYMVSKNYPWFVRGGSYDDSANAGVFTRYFNYGISHYNRSARVVGFGK